MTLSMLMAGLMVTMVAGASMAAEEDIMTPRVSPKEIQIARALKNPLPQTSETIAMGKKVYQGKGSCVLCHGVDGRGTGMGAPSLEQRANSSGPSSMARSGLAWWPMETF